MPGGNPYHDERGRFASGDSSGRAEPKGRRPVSNRISTKGINHRTGMPHLSKYEEMHKWFTKLGRQAFGKSKSTKKYGLKSAGAMLGYGEVPQTYW
jgi:hypothetical protein